MNWQQAEVNGYGYFIEKGYRILVPLVSGEGYDFVAEKDGEFIRVNVKLAGLKDKSNPNSWAISTASGASRKRKDNNLVDCYLVWMPSLERFVELDGQFLNTGNSKSRRIPATAYLS